MLLPGGPRWKRLERAACVMELRRLRGLVSPLAPPWEPSVDMVAASKAETRGRENARMRECEELLEVLLSGSREVS